jgi:hypothetical protein
MCVCLAGYLLFVFSTVDLLHVHPSSYGQDSPASNESTTDEGCPACFFKNGANSLQIAIDVTPESHLEIVWHCLPASTTPKTITRVGTSNPRGPPLS